MTRPLLKTTLLTAFVLASPFPARGATDSGAGWSLVGLDLEIRVEPRGGRLLLAGEMVLRLEGADESYGPLLWVNSREPVVSFVAVRSEGSEFVRLNGALGDGNPAKTALVRFGESKSRGDEIRIDFECLAEGESGQFAIREDAAVGSWVEGWYPIPMSNEGFGSGVAAATGTTTVHLPRGWAAVTNGSRIERREHGGGVTEVWRLDQPMARSFAFGPYRPTTSEHDGRSVTVYRLTEQGSSPELQAAALSEALAALESRLRPYPYPTYGIAEVPDDISDHFYASSEQGFILAKTEVFNHGENLPLFAHEASHGWWGNLVGSAGSGALMSNEALAQYSMVYALEKVEGADAARRFLDFSRPGYAPLQCARGYFKIARQGNDFPLASMGNGRWQHQLSDSKGMWVYHMLRRQVGDDVFWEVLAGLIDAFAERQITLPDVRAAFVEAAPDAGLERFFAQWLDRSGAPILEARWSGSPPGMLTIEQVQDGEPYELSLVVEVTWSDGRTTRQTLPLRDRSDRFQLGRSDSIESVALDPDHELLIWRQQYGERP